MESREKIMTAALEVFAEKGKHGARMEEIAKSAGVNKAMLYYFFSSKENLFKEVLVKALHGVFNRIRRTLQQSGLTGLGPAESVKLVVEKHFEAFVQDVPGTKIVLEAFVHEPSEIKRALDQICTETTRDNPCQLEPQRMTEILKAGIVQKIFRPIDVSQLFVSILGMSLIYFSARPIAQLFLGLNAKDEKKFLEQRQASITDLLLHGILEKEATKHA
ncbi:MAG: TetR/AcrR family transcriptional regulator [Candidatus Firestonebacteria bacterium]|nr:TetR/AcrR family transcriptional regulator [Candidatus Firestonebacteria bacterium]